MLYLVFEVLEQQYSSIIMVVRGWFFLMVLYNCKQRGSSGRMRLLKVLTVLRFAMNLLITG